MPQDVNNGLPPLPTFIPPCPFCGAVLKRDDKRNTGAAHPVDGYGCLLSGWFIGATQLSKFARRAGLGMKIIEGHPVFNQEGRGQSVDIEMVNKTLAYYKEQTK